MRSLSGVRDWEKALTLPSRQGCVLIALEKRDVVEGAEEGAAFTKNTTW